MSDTFVSPVYNVIAVPIENVVPNNYNPNNATKTFNILSANCGHVLFQSKFSKDLKNVVLTYGLMREQLQSAAAWLFGKEI